MDLIEPLFHTEALSFGGFLHYKDLSFPSGKISFVTGESGSGKSTLFKILNGTLSPSSGRAYYRGEDIASIDAIRLRREVSLIAQDPYLFDGSVRENFEAYYGYRQQRVPTDRQITALLASFRLDFSPNAPVQTFSGGEKQRLFIAIFLSFRPKVLLLDEPTSSLDYATGLLVLSAVRDACLQNGSEWLVVSHSARMADAFSQNTLQLGKEAAL